MATIGKHAYAEMFGPMMAATASTMPPADSEAMKRRMLLINEGSPGQ